MNSFALTVWFVCLSILYLFVSAFCCCFVCAFLWVCVSTADFPCTFVKIQQCFVHSLKMGHSRPLFRLFSMFFQTNIITIFRTNQFEKCPSSIQCWDSNPRPLKHKSSPVENRPGLQLMFCSFLSHVCSSIFLSLPLSSYRFIGLSFRRCLVLTFRVNFEMQIILFCKTFRLKQQDVKILNIFIKWPIPNLFCFILVFSTVMIK